MFTLLIILGIITFILCWRALRRHNGSSYSNYGDGGSGTYSDFGHSHHHSNNDSGSDSSGDGGDGGGDGGGGD